MFSHQPLIFRSIRFILNFNLVRDAALRFWYAPSRLINSETHCRRPCASGRFFSFAMQKLFLNAVALPVVPLGVFYPYK